MEPPKAWLLVHNVNAPILQNVALKLTYSFIHSLKRNKMTPQRAEDLIFVHSSLLLSRISIARDKFGSLDDFGILEIANLSLDEVMNLI
ncbi:hypothetical protein MTR_3g057310 [Medicago truncatula]|uniref:Uncharacterized protein n=1 Tax=Medicago truncatula TaxID=3880 RepID=G7ZY03_MEDTR|nr:hypothetical protein MTR_3g057310 [Medicago truncatula]